eukprot:4819288-Prymnesium_polylepis.1
MVYEPFVLHDPPTTDPIAPPLLPARYMCVVASKHPRDSAAVRAAKPASPIDSFSLSEARVADAVGGEGEHLAVGELTRGDRRAEGLRGAARENGGDGSARREVVAAAGMASGVRAVRCENVGPPQIRPHRTTRLRSAPRARKDGRCNPPTDPQRSASLGAHTPHTAWVGFGA